MSIMNLIVLSNSESQIVWGTSKMDYENTFTLGKSVILYNGRLCQTTISDLPTKAESRDELITHLETIPGLGTLTTRSLTGGNA